MPQDAAIDTAALMHARERIAVSQFRTAQALDRLAEHQPHHLNLLTKVPTGSRRPSGTSRIDALVVPTCRPFRETRERLLSAASVADELGGVLVLLCSKEARIEELQRAVRACRTPVLALDAEAWRVLLPRFETSAHPLARVDDWDTPEKRNVALLLAAGLGWQTVMFLDDDVHVVEEATVVGHGVSAVAVRTALAAMEADPFLRLVGWRADDFPDNSVVCHARRLAGLPQDTFVGGGALLARVGTDVPFFPRVYNEDWLFHYRVLRHLDHRPWKIGDAGTVAQAPYDPFRASRAVTEEVGDVLAEGLFQVLGRGPRAEAQVYRREYWTAVIQRRLAMILDLRTRLAGVPLGGPYGTAEDLRMDARAALVAAETTLRGYGDELAPLFVDFTTGWRADLRRWRKHLRRVHEKPAWVETRLLDESTTTLSDPARRRLGLPCDFEPATMPLSLRELTNC